MGCLTHAPLPACHCTHSRPRVLTRQLCAHTHAHPPHTHTLTRHLCTRTLLRLRVCAAPARVCTPLRRLCVRVCVCTADMHAHTCTRFASSSLVCQLRVCAHTSVAHARAPFTHLCVGFTRACSRLLVGYTPHVHVYISCTHTHTPASHACMSASHAHTQTCTSTPRQVFSLFLFKYPRFKLSRCRGASAWIRPL